MHLEDDNPAPDQSHGSGSSAADLPAAPPAPHAEWPIAAHPALPPEGLPVALPGPYAEGLNSAYPAFGSVPGPVPAPRPRRRGRLIALVSVALVLACAAAGGVTVLTVPALLERLAAGPKAAPGTVPSPQPGDPVSIRQAWVKVRIDAALTAQREALIAGDEQRYLATVDPGAVEAVDGMRIQFRSLRAMQVAAWTDEPYSPSPGADDAWTARLTSTPCFVVPVCAQAKVATTTRWRIEGDHAVLVEWRPDKGDGPAPWQSDELVARSGRRTVVATTPRYAKDLPVLLREAEKAALVADRYAVGEAPVRYPVYYAGSREWERWYGWNPPEWSGGVAINVSADRYELIVNADVTSAAALGGLLRHELTHASSLAGRPSHRPDQWWLVEGLAEVAEMNGRKAGTHGALDDVARFARSWNGDVEVTPPTASTADWQVSARYGLSYLAVRRLLDRYGQAKTMRFFERVVHDRTDVKSAAPEILGAGWTGVEKDLAAFVRRTAR